MVKQEFIDLFVKNIWEKGYVVDKIITKKDVEMAVFGMILWHMITEIRIPLFFWDDHIIESIYRLMLSMYTEENDM